MAFNGLTNAGKEYLATRLANGIAIEISKVEIGSGNAPGNPLEVTALNNLKKQITIIDKAQIENTFKLTVGIDNVNIDTAFYQTEIGIYVNDNGTDVLYHYIYEDNGTYIPDNSSPIAYEWIINTIVTNSESVILDYNGGALFVTYAQLEKKVLDLTKDFDGKLDKKLNKGNLPDNIPNAETILELIKNNNGLEFDENILYIQDVGTKTSGKYYFDKTQIGLWRCIADTDIVYNSANFFVNESIRENADKLENLFTGSLSDIPIGGYKVATIGNIQIVSGHYSHIGNTLDISYPTFKTPPSISISAWNGTGGVITHTGRGTNTCRLINDNGLYIACDIILIGEKP